MYKRTVSLILSLVLLISLLPCRVLAATLSNGTCGDNLTWKLSDTGTMTISGTGAMYDYMDSDPEWYRYKNKIKKVTVKDGVTTIGDQAFWACSKLTDVSLPDSVTSIGISAFSNCPIKEIELPSKLKTIKDRAFETTDLTSVKLPSKLKTIGMMAFTSTKLETVTIPSSVTTIAFEKSSPFRQIETLKEIKVSSSNKNYCAVDGVLFTKDKTVLIQYPEGKSGSSYEIPSSVDKVAAYAFTNAELKRITIPEGVKEIATYAFHYACNLTKIKLPATLQSIGYHAFGSCKKLESFSVASGSKWFSTKDGVLFNKDKTELIRYPMAKTTREYTVPGTVTYIHPEAFDYNKSLFTLTIPDRVTELGGYITNGCSSLMMVIFQGGAPECSYPRYAFDWDGVFACYPVDAWTSDEVRAFDIDDDGEGNLMVPYDPKLSVPKVTAKNDYTTGKIKLTWPAVAGAESYIVYRSSSKYGPYECIDYSVADTEYTDTSNILASGGKAKAGEKYYYMVAARDADDVWSLRSAAVARTCNLPRTEVTAKNTASSGKTKLSWEKVSGAEKYTVYRATSEDGEYKKLDTTTKTSFTDSTARVGKRYYYKVVAVHENTSANSAKSLPVARTRDLPQPEISVKLNSSKQPKVSWEAIDQAEKYQVYRKEKGDDSYEKIGTTSKTSYTDKNAKKGITYYYRVVAVHENTGANSARSDYVKIKP